MKKAVSKTRSKQTKKRAKEAEKASARKGHYPDAGSPVVGVLIGCAMWLSALILLHARTGFQVDLHTLYTLLNGGFLLLLGLIGCGVLLRLTQPAILGRNAELFLLYLISLLPLAAVSGLLYAADYVPAASQWIGAATASLLPLALAPFLATILLGATVGIAVGAWVSFGAALLAGSDLEILLMGMLLTVVAAYFARCIRKRSTIFRIGMILALTQALFVVANALATPSIEMAVSLRQLAACILNGALTAVIVLLVIPLMEAIFKITTDITLIELSDLGNPLLQRLAIEAPGTYHHSLVVANLAQAAADKIGANSLLARVCAYFHDIGKLTKPDFFAENIQLSANPHDELAPSMSTLVITAHVKEGISLAMLNKLPRPVLDVIREHHGTGLVQFFHHKAKQQLELELATNSPDAPAPVSEEDFRYGGPKPSTRESAIISLADSVEAASRSLQKPSPSHIENLVAEVTNTKLLDGQLDRCDMTFDELRRVKESFVFTITNMLHGRIAYPKDEDLDKQQSNGKNSQPSENTGPGASANGVGATNNAR